MESTNPSQLRSISLPSRSNPSFSQIEINLNKLKTLEPFYSSTRIHTGLACLTDLYTSVNELLGSTQTQKVNLQSRNKVLIEDALVRSTRLMDSYGSLLELLGQMKGSARVLQFALRRKGVATYSTTDGHLMDYFLSRKKAKKNIVACVRSLEQMEREIESCLVDGEDHHLSMVIRVLREIVTATISLFRYVLVILSGKPKLDHKLYTFITRLMQTGKPSCHKSQEIINDADMIDLTLDSLWKDIKTNECKTVDVQMVMERLHKLDREIEGHEVGLDCLFRKLLQTRVSLLNILAN
ncbi:hypothetical protein HanRHA438_Chr15g0713261 [Helianthus annuus]|uniref:DUF241 domain protein n=1 Tax=Helianthus annuus TaxID=4232 RepID=A0A9K3H3M5_HELAN|nr:uncharacterized protein LOC110913879 [Helianthus annuus]KAF5765206.1 hypothetical protein HanXRQr2_Chr15g0701051 [Helianthus annuus]KAJ0451769.1 hypothetical protein HanHA300_Chr15g0571351 [Helianthus annuus]KAJ0456430.1 hypothetical protein HanIR_Chr15g0762401 [Helianthus annuus]KAJ0473655.1 hypothetical protein HanHA89_Chr15g0620821 [Helianthus annuus]KAJ0649232.1 hypothetical protein HanLR1_Chr15g0581921 [Helianthus annuus]